MAMSRLKYQWALAACAVMLAADGAKQTTNSIGIALVEIPAGSFQMGVDSTPIPAELLKGPNGVIYDRPSNEGDYDEAPVHKVTISKPFLIAVTEVTVEQFQTVPPRLSRQSLLRAIRIGRELERRGGLLRVAQQEGRQAVPPAHRSRMGVRRARRASGRCSPSRTRGA